MSGWPLLSYLPFTVVVSLLGFSLPDSSLGIRLEGSHHDFFPLGTPPISGEPSAHELDPAIALDGSLPFRLERARYSMILNIRKHMSLAGLPARLVAPILCRSGKALPSQPPLHRSFVLAAALICLWTAACGDGGTGPAPARPNQSPVRIGAIPAQTLGVGETGTINVAEYFNDPDRDALTYTAASANAATASVAVVGSVVTITAAAQGVASVAVTRP